VLWTALARQITPPFGSGWGAARAAASDATGTILLGNAPKDNLRERKDFGGMGEW
jgi:hypothetical protein